MFCKHHAWLCACLSVSFSGFVLASEMPTDEEVKDVAEVKSVSHTSSFHEVRTRLGTFGPMARIKLPLFKVVPRFESVTGYTETGVPISRRKQWVIDRATKLAAEWESRYQEALKDGRVKARPKVKTQADLWEEENARILADEAKYGRKTSDTFIMPGMTPRSTQSVNRAQVSRAVMRGGEKGQGVVVASGGSDSHPTDGEEQSFFPDMSLSEKSTRHPYLPSKEILEAFPDSPVSEKYRSLSPRSEAGESLSLTGSHRRDFLSAAGWWDQTFCGLFGLTSAFARAAHEDDPQLAPKRMTGAFDALARQMAEDKKVLDQRLKETTSLSPAEGEEKSSGSGVCDACRLTADDFARAGVVAKAISDRATARALSADDSKTIRDITAVLNDPKHPASFINMLKEALKENPIVTQHIPDAWERLGVESDSSTPQEGTYIFVSHSLGDNVLTDILRRHAGRPDVTIVMRGIPQGMSLGEGIKHMQALASQFDPMPNVILDPTLFSQYGVTVVPSVVRVLGTQGVMEKFSVASRITSKASPNHPMMVAKVDGLHNDEWLNQKIERDNCSERHPCLFGQQGPVFPIDEPDMIEEMKRRVASIDWEKKKSEAMKRFWTNQTFDALPLARESVTRVLDPSIHVVADINDANGNPVRRAGDVVNPLDMRPFTSVLVVFNPTREEEMAAVLAKVARLREKGYGKFIYMATALDRSSAYDDKDMGPGWGHYEAVCDRLDSHVYLLTPEVKERWDIRVTPTFVTADNAAKRFLIEEVAPERAK